MLATMEGGVSPETTVLVFELVVPHCAAERDSGTVYRTRYRHHAEGERIQSDVF